jgi:drug/metabolite transporter (DMT)-like permease
MESSEKGILFLVVSAISFGLMPIFAKLSYQAGVNVGGLLFVRFLIAFAVMGTVLSLSHRLALPSRKDLVLLFVLGSLGYFLQSSFYFTSLLYSPVPVVVLILYTYPVFVTVGSHLLGWESITRRVAVSVAIAVVGLILVANPFGSPLGLGATFAFLASITYTVYILSSSGVLKRVRGELASFYVIGAACLSFGLATFGTGSLSLDWQLSGWVWILLIALVSTVVAVTAFFLGLSLIGPSRSSLISLLEPLTSVVLSFMVFGEFLATVQVVGGALILLAALVVATSRKEGHRP